MADSGVDVLIVGAGARGRRVRRGAARARLRGSIVLAGRDVDPPYERPYCSKDYLRGGIERAETYLALPDDLDLRIRTSVMKLDPAARTAKLSSGEELTFGQAVLATGANVRRLRVDGGQLEGIHYLRTLGNADAIRADAAKGAERRADRRLVHRVRGRGVADRAGLPLHAGDAGGAPAVAGLRARRRRVLRGRAARARRRLRRRRRGWSASRATASACGASSPRRAASCPPTSW